MATLARTVAEVHRSGVVHDGLTVAAVLVDEHGRPVLAGFGGARATTSPIDRRVDVVALTTMARSLLDDLGRAPDSDEARRRRRLDRILRRHDLDAALDLSERLASVVRQIGPSADEFATDEQDGGLDGGLIHAPTDQGNHSGPGTSDRALRARVRARSSGPDRRSVLAAGLVGSAMLVGTVALAWSALTGPTADESATVPTTTPGAPEVAVGGFAYRVGRPGDVAVVRACRGELSVWLLRPSSGALYQFDVPSGEEAAPDVGPVAAQPLRFAPGATDLAVHRVLDCDHVHLLLRDGGAIEVGD